MRWVVIPLVDAGRIESAAEESEVLGTFLGLSAELARLKTGIAFECDYEPERLARFIGRLPAEHFGVNYDIGNSASLGYEPRREIGAYGARIVNVHIKDRVRSGSTVPLGTGAADFPAVFEALRGARYTGNFILQTARAADGDHAGALARYRAMAEQWLTEAMHAA
jgi:hexulose-6-phosphate isomerase